MSKSESNRAGFVLSLFTLLILRRILSTTWFKVGIPEFSDWPPIKETLANWKIPLF